MHGNISEFTDSYSDDMIFLQVVRRSLLRHPLEYHYPKFLDATLARLHAVMLVGNTENAIGRELDRTGDSRLDRYLNSRISGTEKVDSLRDYLQDRLGGSVDAEVLDDYLAIKYLRNGIIHSDPRKDNQAEHVKTRGFPLDSRELTLDHLHRFAQVDQLMTEYLGMSQLLESVGVPEGIVGAPSEAAKQSNGLTGSSVTPESRIATDEDVSEPYAFGEFIQMHRSSLDKIGSSWVRLLNEHAGVTGPEFSKRVLTGDIEDHAKKRLQGWGKVAVYSWGEIVRLWPDDLARRLVDDEAYRTELLDQIRAVSSNRAFPAMELPSNFYLELWRKMHSLDFPGDAEYKTLFGASSELTGIQLLETYAAGQVAYNLIAQIGTGWIWPMISRDGSKRYISKALAFIDIIEIGTTWYTAIEWHESLAEGEKETLEQYRSGILDTEI